MQRPTRRTLLKAAIVAAGAACGVSLVYDLLHRHRLASKDSAKQDEWRHRVEAIKPLETEGMIARMGLPQFLAFWNKSVLLRLQSLHTKLDTAEEAILAGNTIFLPPATAAQIAAAEQRTGLSFPPSLRAFLLHANGVKPFAGDAKAEPDLFPCEKMVWLNELDPELVEIWNKESGPPVSDADYYRYGKEQDPAHMRSEYMKHALALGPVVDGGVFLLNPQVKFSGGEIEAWDFSVKYPGATRYRSFEGLLEARCSSSCTSIELRKLFAEMPPRP